MMFESALISLLVAAAVPQAPVTIVQKTRGWCSPAIANVVGNVTVNCIGVDPRALKRLNGELNRKNLELADKIREADEWDEPVQGTGSTIERSGRRYRSLASSRGVPTRGRVREGRNYS